MVWSKITALVLSIISMFLAITVYGSTLVFYIAPLGLIFGIVALVLNNNYNKENSEVPESKTMAIVSIVLSSLAILIAIIILIIRIVFLGGIAIVDEISSNNDYDFADSYDWEDSDYCDDDLVVGESATCGDIELEYNDFSKDGNKYTFTYTITNNGYSDYEFDLGYDPIINYDDFDFDFANEDDSMVITEDSEKQIVSTFDVESDVTPTNVEIELEDGYIYLEF